ncbi:hypothetical protein A7985_25300 [Pseudoalteromonas luteoviolacea]|uniref:Uncharacterized protein n=1 Tax=Pseudoalteromonas luteoviolacea TaxID=43657 RepID=A0A1C0TIR2_9GAMM|nr:hypothetical protein [Pseudoalteromonas luteoviolacea]OCQ17890.1 hypothetical protein A7985_25300 [Pseudoalteromonas luteoviolacea]
MFDELKKYIKINSGSVIRNSDDQSELILIELDERVFFGIEVFRDNICLILQDLEICKFDQMVKGINFSERYSIFSKVYISQIEYRKEKESKYESELLHILAEVNDRKIEFLKDYYSSLDSFQIPTFFTSKEIAKNHCTAVYFGLINRLIIDSNISSEEVEEITAKYFKPGFGSFVIMQQINRLKLYLNSK